MMKKVAVLTVLIIACFAAGAMAAEGPYLSGNLGVTMTADSDVSDGGISGEIKYDAGYAIGGALGYNFGGGRLEAEIGYKAADIDKISLKGLGSTGVNGDLKVLSYMANGYIDLNVNPTVKPFLMVGVGMAEVKYDSSDLGIDDSDIGFAFQLGAGVGFALNDKVALDLSYRFMRTDDPYINNTEIEYGSHNLLAGVRVQF